MIEPLEPRLLLSGDLSWVAAADAALMLRLVAGDPGTVELVESTTGDQLATAALADLGGASGPGVTIDAAGFDVDLTIDAGVLDATQLREAGGIVFHGGDGHDRLFGPDADAAWRIDGRGEGELADGLVRFDGVEDLIGGTGDDVFTLTREGGVAGTIDGGLGSDLLRGDDAGRIWMLDGDGAGWISRDPIDGSASPWPSADGANAGDLLGLVDLPSATVGALRQAFGGFETVEGGTGRDVFAVGPDGALAGGVRGGGGADSIVAPDTDNAWSIDGTDAGALNGLAFDGIENLVGGAGRDVFAFTDGAQISGAIRGGGGHDVLDYGAMGAGVVVDLAAAQATGAAAVDGIDEVIGSPFDDVLAGDLHANTLRGEGGDDLLRVGQGNDLFEGGAGSDTLSGPDGTLVWYLLGPGSGTVAATAFGGVENLAAGAGHDTVIFIDDGALAGTVDGGGGFNVADWTLAGAAAAVQLLTSADPQGAAGVRNMQRLRAGGGEGDTIHGPDGTVLWTVEGTGVGQVGGAEFSGFERVVGGAGDDTFLIADGGFIAEIEGGGGRDTLSFGLSSAGAIVDLAGTSASGVGSFDGIEALAGGAGADVLRGPAADTEWHLTGIDSGDVAGFQFGGFETVEGAANNEDTFIIGPGAGVTGVIEGGDGGFDTVVIEDGGYARRIYQASGPNSGSITLDSTVIYYAGVEPLTDMGVGGAVVYFLTAGNDTDAMLTSSSAQDFSLTGSTFETTNFMVTGATTSVTVNLGAGNDTITLAGLAGTNINDKLIVAGGAGNDTIKLGASWGTGVELQEVGGQGTADKLDFGDYLGALSIAPMLDGSVDITSGGNSLTLESTAAQNFESIAGANINLGATARDALVGGLKDMVTFIRDLASVGQFATDLPLLGKNAKVAVAKALDFAEAIDELRYEVEQYLVDHPVGVTTDALLAKLNMLFDVTTQTLEHLGASILSPLKIDNADIAAADVYEFQVMVDGAPATIKVDVNASTTPSQVGDVVTIGLGGNPADYTVDNVLGAINLGLGLLGATQGKLQAQLRDGRFAFRVLDPQVTDFSLQGAQAAVSKLGFENGVPVVLAEVNKILSGLGDLELSVPSGISLGVAFDGGTPKLSFDVGYHAQRTSEFVYSLGAQAQSLGLAFDADATIQAMAELVFDFALDLDLNPLSTGFSLDINELRAGLSTTASAAGGANLDIGFLAATTQGGSTLDFDAGITVDTTGLTGITDPTAISIMPGDLMLTGSDGTGMPSFALSLMLGVASSSSLGGFSASASLTASGDPFSGSDVTLTTGGDFSQFFDFTKLNVGGVVSVLKQVADWLGKLSESDAIGGIDLPFIQGKLDKVLALAEVFNDALLYSDGADDLMDGSNKLVTDVNAALTSAGLGDQIRAQGDGARITFIAVNPDITAFSVSGSGGAGDIGVTVGGAASTTDGVLSFEANVDAVIGGQLGSDATLHFTITKASGPTMTDVNVAMGSTSDNVGIGDDVAKLLDAANKANFSNAQELARLLATIIDLGPVDYDPMTQVLTYDIAFTDVPLFDIDLPTDFSLDFSPIGNISSPTKLIVEASAGLSLTLGFDLSDSPPGANTLDDMTTLDDLGIEIKKTETVVAQNEPRSLVGRLSANANLTVVITGGPQAGSHMVQVLKSETDPNESLANLVTDINTALTVAGINGEIQAMASGDKVKLVAVGGMVTGFTVSTTVGDPGFRDLGFQGRPASPEAATLDGGMLTVTGGKAVPKIIGQLQNDATFHIEFNDATPGRDVTVTKLSTVDPTASAYDNKTLLDLVSDVQKALDAAFSGPMDPTFEVTSSNGRLLFTRTDAETAGATDGFTISPGANSAQLGITAMVSSSETDLLITIDDGMTYPIVLDGVTDIGGVIAAITAQTGTKVTAMRTVDDPMTPGDEADTGLTLIDTTAGVSPSGNFEVTGVNGSLAAVGLGLAMMDASPDDPQSDPDGKIVGGSIAGASLLDRFFITADDLSSIVSATLDIGAGIVLRDVAVTATGGGMTTLTASGYDFMKLDSTAVGNGDISIDLRGIAGLTEGSYVVTQVVNGTTIKVMGIAGAMGQTGGEAVLRSGVEATATFGFVGIGLTGTASFGAELSLGFNPAASALADGKLTLNELRLALGSIFDLVTLPSLTPSGGNPNFGQIAATVGLSAGSADFGSLAGSLLGGSPSADFTLITFGDPLMATRFGQAGYARTSASTFTLMGDFTGMLTTSVTGVDDFTLRFVGPSSSTDVKVTDATFNGSITTVTIDPGEGSSFDLPSMLDGYSVVLLPAVKLETSDLGDLPDFSDLDFNDIIAMLQALTGFLTQFEAFDFLDTKLPVIDKSVNDLLGYADDLAAAVEDARTNPSGSLQALETKLNEAIGLTTQQLTDAFGFLGMPVIPSLTDDVFDLGFDTSAGLLTLDFSLGAGFVRGLDFKIPGIDFSDTPLAAILGNFLDLSGSAGLSAEGAVVLRLSLGVDVANFDISDPTSSLYLLDTTGLDAKLTVSGQHIAFRVGVGPFSLSIADDDPMISQISIGAEANAGLDSSIFDSDGKVALSSVLGNLGASFDGGFSGTVSGLLPVFFPNDATRSGEIRIGGSNGAGNFTPTGSLANLFDGGGLQIATDDPMSTPLTANSVVIDVHSVKDGISGFNFDNFSLFDNIALAVDSLDLLLATVQDVIGGNFGNFEIPLIGKDIAKGADFIGSLRDEFVAPLQQGLDDVSDFLTSFNDPNNNALSELLFELLGPGGLGLLQPAGGARSLSSPADGITLDASTLVDYLLDPNTLPQDTQLEDTEIIWRFNLGDSYDVATDIGFDLGIPGLGLKTEGDITFHIGWNLSIGIGISFKDGFFFEISSPHELLFDVGVTLPAAITGTLGFLGLRATDETLMINGQPHSTELGATFKVDIQEDGATGVDAERLSFTELGAIKFDLGIAAEASAVLDVELGLSDELFGELFGSGAANVIKGFPKLGADFIFLWELGTRGSGGTLSEMADNSTFQSLNDLNFDSIEEGLQLVKFQDVRIELGSFLSDVLGPIVEEVSKFTEPIQPIIDFITSDIPIISAIGLHVTWLDLAELLTDVDTSLIESVAEIITLINTIDGLSGAGEVALPIGDITIYEQGGIETPIWQGNLDLKQGFSDIADAGGLNDLIGAAGGIGAALDGLTGLTRAQRDTANALGDVVDGSSAGGFAFPMFEDPTSMFGLLLGQPVDIVTYDLGRFDLDFEWSQFFSIFGPLGASIGLVVQFYADTAFGYDTQGIQDFVESGFRNPGLLFNGFYISDSPMLNGVDDPEVVFSTAFFATAELNLGIARGGVRADLGFKILFDLFDPNNDGKIRITELVGNFTNQLRSSEPALAPLAIFDVRGEIFAVLSWFLEIGFSPFSVSFDGTIFGPVTLLSFDVDFYRPPVLASEVAANGDLIVHTGKFASERLLGNAKDVGETLTIQSAGTDGDYVNVKIKGTSALGDDASDFQDYKVKKGSKIIIDGGEGNDTFDLSGFTENDVLFEIDGGAGNDVITLGTGNGVLGKFSTVHGGTGDDMITGSGGSDMIFGGMGNDTIDAGGGDDLVFGDEGEVGSDTVRSMVRPTDGRDLIMGGTGFDIIFGSGGKDDLSGGADDDLIVAGGGVVFFTNDMVQKIRPNVKMLETDPVKEVENRLLDPQFGDTVHGDGGADVIYGTAGPDTIFGGADGDTIFGFGGFDEIHGDAGNDVIFGDGGRKTADGEWLPYIGGDADTIFGGAGMDLIFGGNGGDTIHGDGEADRIYGGAGPDFIYGDAGDDVIFGEGGPDTIEGGTGVDSLEGGVGPDSVFGGDDADVLIGGTSSDYLDGEDGGDTYLIRYTGGSSVAVATVFDSGASGVDLFVGTGTVFDDNFLLRSNGDGSSAFVALINSEYAVERVNYQEVERIVINGSFGDDYFAVDDTAAEITINGEFGNDRFQVGQLFRSERIEPNVLMPDAEFGFATIETTRGFLSNGISAPMTINGGIGDDQFVVYHNRAVLQLNGDVGNDEFEIRAFALIGSQEPQRERTDISGGAGADLVQYAVNAPVNIDGGDGLDTVTIIGTEFGDDFVITDKGVFGAGLNVNFVNIESLRVDGAEGDDRFYVKSTSEKIITEIYGGLGSDTVDFGGDTPPVVSNDLKGHSGLVVHDVESTDERFDGQTILGVSANVADNEEPFAVIRQTDGSTIIDEGGGQDSYDIVLTRQPDRDVLVSALAPIPSPDSRELRQLFFRVSSPTADQTDMNGTNVTLRFTKTNWYVPQTVVVSADTMPLTDIAGLFTRPELGDGQMFTMDDAGTEGLRFGIVNHIFQTEDDRLEGMLTSVDNDPDTPKIVIPDTGVLINEMPLLGRTVLIKKGEGQGQVRRILAAVDQGTTYELTLDRPFLSSDVPTNASEFLIRIDDAIVGVMSSFTEDAFIGSDPKDHRSIFEDSTASFPTTGEGLTGAVLEIIGGPGLGQQRLILGHVSGSETTSLILNGGWRTDPVMGESVYRIARYEGLAIPSVQVQINDNDRPGVIVDETQGFESADAMVDPGDVVPDFDTITAVVEGGDGDHLGEKDVLRLRLSANPGGTPVQVGLKYDAAQILVKDLSGNVVDMDHPVDFNSGTWNVAQSLVVEALVDGLREGFHTELIEFVVSAGSDVASSMATDTFATIPAEQPEYSVGLSHRPTAVTSVTIDGGAPLTEADAAGVGGDYIVLDNKVVFVDGSGGLVAISGDVVVSYQYDELGFLQSVTAPVLTRIDDADAPTVIVRESGGSTDVIETRKSLFDPSAIPAFFDTDRAPWIDSYDLVLSGQPTGDVTVTVAPDITKTTRTGGIRHDMIQVALSSVDPRATAVMVNVGTPGAPIMVPGLQVTFDDSNWDSPLTVEVRAIDDAVVDGGDTKEFAQGPKTVSRILGPVIVEGAGGQGSLNTAYPLLLPGETNVKEKTGDVVSVSGTEVTVATADLNAILANVGVMTLADLVNKTIEVTTVNPETNLFHSAIGQFRLITGVQVNGAETVLTINEAYAYEDGEGDGDIVGYAITSESLNFFVKEPESIDFMFVHDEDSPADSAGWLTPTRLYGLNMGPDLAIGGVRQAGGISYNDLEVLEVNLGTGNNDFTVLGTPTRSDGYQTWTLLNTGNDIEWMGVQGDTVHVNLNREDETLATGSVVSAQNPDGILVDTTTVTLDQAFADDSLIGKLIRIVDDGMGTPYATDDIQERWILGNSGNTLTLNDTWTALPDGETYEIVDPADGDFAVNTQGGDDTVDASASSLGITMFGGLGDDTLTGGSGDDVIFGDRGRVDYVNWLGAIVTRLGDAPEPLTGLVTTQVTPATLDTLVDSGATFPVPDDLADGMGTDDVGLRGLYVDINNGFAFLQPIVLISDNTATTLTLTPGFDPELDLPGPVVMNPSEYRISTIPEDQTDGVVREASLLITVDSDQGGDDTIDAGAGNDQVFGGAGSDTISGGGDDDVVIGDAGRIDRTRDPLAPEELVRFTEVNGAAEVKSFVDRVRTISWNTGGDDTISGNAGADLLLGGAGDDTIHGDDAGDAAGSADLADIILGDNGEAIWNDAVDPDLSTLDIVTTRGVPFGGADTISGGADNDMILGGTDGDEIAGGADQDLVLGDFGRITLLSNLPRLVETTDRTAGGADTIYGDAGDDILVGGAQGDAVDGGAGDDLVFGDQVRLSRLGDLFQDFTDPRYRVLAGQLLYGRGPASDRDPARSSSTATEIDPTRQFERPGGGPAWADWVPDQLDHSAAIAVDPAFAGSFGDDYLAGGADDDTIFGQLGDDVIQGDGSIAGLIAGTPVLAQRELDGTLTVVASFEAPTDGDDYIEGNGGSDVVFGGLGQDDIVGGSSSLFSLVTPDLRPDGSDLLFGGAGTEISRDHTGNETADGHARDADVILGDNGNIYRIVGTGGVETGAYPTFNYDDYSSLRLIPRAAELLDYTPGGADVDTAAAATDLGAGDEIHGESGDDTVYGMTGSDVIFGEGQDDDLIGGYGNDWISGGAGQDGILGDDGRIQTSRNDVNPEPLYGIDGIPASELDLQISTPGHRQEAVINVSGELKKTVNATPFFVDDTGTDPSDPHLDPQNADDVIYGGWGGDFIHGGAGDDAISGAEALAMYYAVPHNPGNLLRFGEERPGEFAAYDEYDPWRKVFVDDNGVFTGDGSGNPFLLNFEASDGQLDTTYDSAGTASDGNDVIFGDLGNDWIVGGTGRDHLYGGWGDDLLNVDDDHDTTAGSSDPTANDAPDTDPTYNDIAYGGAGRDVLIGNTGGDRMIDWAGEFNSYVVPFSPFGAPTISRSLQPHLFDYLYDLSASDGADQTRAADAGSDPARNGEPFGELGLVTQHDDAWQDQTGGPADPQPGNHNGKRDVVDSATFESGSTAGFTADAGSTGVQGKYLVVKATPGGADGASLFYIDQRIGEVFDVETTLKASLPKDGLSSSNAFVLFDYDSAESFKFAGFDALSGQLQIGRRTAEGWQVLASVAAPIAPGHDYAVTLNVEDGQVLLRAADRSLSYTFSLPGVPLERLGDGQVGVGARDAAALASSYTVLAPPWPITLSATEAFTFGTPARFHGGTGQWTAFDGRYTGMPEAGSGYAVRFDGALPPVGVNQAAMIELDAMLSASELGGFVFDAHGDRDFKFAALLPSAGQVVLGHRRDQDGWVIDMVAAVTLQPGIDHRLTVKLEGTGVGISVDGELRIQHAYTTSPVDGRIGLLGGLGGATFDWVGVRTNDPALQASSDGTNQAPDAQADGSDGIVDFNQTYTASGDPTSAGTTGTAGTAGSAGTTGTDGGTTFGGPALGGLRGGLAWGERTATRADGGTTRTVPLRLDVSNWLIDIDDLEGER